MSISLWKTIARLILFSSVSLPAGADSVAGPTPESIHIQRCSACHYVDGKSAGPEFPNIAGQYEIYLMNALKLFKDNKRESDAMELIASLHKEQELVILANYYAKQKPAGAPSIASPDQTLAVRGRSSTRQNGFMALPVWTAMVPMRRDMFARAHALEPAAPYRVWPANPRAT